MIHKVKAGETLSAIAKKYGTTVPKIKAANAALITNVNMIKVGWNLVIPDTAAAAPAPDPVGILEQLEKTIKAVEALPEFKALEALLDGN